jgi:hypothetical protein
MELEIAVTLQEQDGAYTGTIDIPQQGAAGIPLQNISVAEAAVHFEMLPEPQTAIFDGEVAADGSISGTMVQSGYEGTFTLAPRRLKLPALRRPALKNCAPASPAPTPTRRAASPCRFPPTGRLLSKRASCCWPTPTTRSRSTC